MPPPGRLLGLDLATRWTFPNRVHDRAGAAVAARISSWSRSPSNVGDPGADPQPFIVESNWVRFGVRIVFSTGFVGSHPRRSGRPTTDGSGRLRTISDNLGVLSYQRSIRLSAADCRLLRRLPSRSTCCGYRSTT